MSECQKPNCRTSSSETYNDEHGNELSLCEKHYYELVSGKSVTEKRLGTGVGVELTRDIETSGSGVLDGISREIDLPDRLDGPDTVPEDARIGNVGTTPCPDCGKPMGMVTWTGQKPSCHRCQDTTPTVWMSGVEPDGSEIVPTTNRWEPLGSEQLSESYK